MSDRLKVLGLMSGSSMDGVDLAYCDFKLDNQQQWTFNILHSKTIPYSDEWMETLKTMPSQSAEIIAESDINYGSLLGKMSKSFVDKHRLTPDFIASHGHTIFHKPQLGYTFQLGNGQAIATKSGFRVVSDFRTKDILYGGQGAPLVPIGDELLFSKYGLCLNLGGIANVSYKENGRRIAFDICAANQLLNYLSQQLGKPYDEGGKLAQEGDFNANLFNKLNSHPYYLKTGPKSLGNEDVRDSFINLIDESSASIADKLYTVVKHIAQQLHFATNHLPEGKMLITGGGAYNDFLIEQFQKLSSHTLSIPDKQLIDFKEALIFAFMGVRRMRNEVNCLSSVTGATRDSCSGVIFNP